MKIASSFAKLHSGREEIALLEKKGTLISRQLAGFQAAYLLTVFRQSVLAAPADVARRLVAAGLVAPEREHEAQQIIKADFCAQLAEFGRIAAAGHRPELDRADRPRFPSPG